jgi:hypothetical protein
VNPLERLTAEEALRDTWFMADAASLAARYTARSAFWSARIHRFVQRLDRYDRNAQALQRSEEDEGGFKDGVLSVNTKHGCISARSTGYCGESYEAPYQYVDLVNTNPRAKCAPMPAGANVARSFWKSTPAYTIVKL